jgi:hypothetical protein
MKPFYFNPDQNGRATGWLILPNNWIISIGFAACAEEDGHWTVWDSLDFAFDRSWLRFLFPLRCRIERPMTDQEREEQEEAAAEYWAEQKDLGRYVAWHDYL